MKATRWRRDVRAAKSLATVPRVIVARTIAECRAARAAAAARVGFVPTMGALHDGHLSLVAEARRRADRVVVSIFVNPTQFAPGEDFARYPRPIERDLELCAAAGVDVVFNPSPDEIYRPAEAAVAIDLPSLTDRLEGTIRPGHFAGVCRVVAKLFHIVSPDVACFGEKDFQQLAVIRAMASGLDWPIEIVGCPTLRDADGLAMSSRNRYLSADERARGLSIPRALLAAASEAAAGERDATRLRSTMLAIVNEAGEYPSVATRIDYATIVDATTLEELATIDRPARALVAMRVGSTRLIDNVAIATD